MGELETEDEKSAISSIKKVGSCLYSNFLQSMWNHLSVLSSDKYKNFIDDASLDSTLTCLSRTCAFHPGIKREL